jgi:spore coat polysaccharide biosynthesis protein SpsF
MNIVAIVQARMSSSRLPGKVLRDIAGEPMLARVVERTRQSSLVNQVVVATTMDPSDDVLVDFCDQRAYPCYRGSLHDVLDRYYQAARNYQAHVILRITSDCPVVDPGLIDEVAAAFCAGAVGPEALPFDFAANRLPPPWQRTYPIGLDVEMCTFPALERAWKEADQKFQREHVMPFFYEGLELPGVQPLKAVYSSPRGFRVLLMNTDRGPGSGKFSTGQSSGIGGLRWTVDTPDDLELMQQVYAHFGGRMDFTWLDVLDLFAQRPELADINARVAAKHVRDTDKRTI